MTFEEQLERNKKSNVHIWRQEDRAEETATKKP